MTAQPNPFVGKNYIPDNPRMDTPPAFWLQRIYDYDADLVVLPSRQRPYAYVLARRSRQPMTVKALADIYDQADTKMCMQLGLVPVSLIYRTGVTWSIDNIIATLQRRDLWRHGGGEKSADIMDASDAREEKAKQDKVRDDMWQRAGFGYQMYKRRTGQRVTSPGMGSERHLPTTSSSGSTAGSGIALTDA